MISFLSFKGEASVIRIAVLKRPHWHITAGHEAAQARGRHNQDIGIKGVRDIHLTGLRAQFRRATAGPQAADPA